MTTTRQSSQSLFPLTRRRASTLATLLGVVAVLTACGDKKQAAATGAPPAPEVGVMTVQPGVVPLTTELPGRLEASRVAEVRARAAGILLKRHFQEGSEVKAGQRLRIDARNLTMMTHPLHLHGHTFALPSGLRKDTVLMAPMQSFALDLDADNAGDWMVHCHNIYHAEAGMMIALNYTA